MSDLVIWGSKIPSGAPDYRQALLIDDEADVELHLLGMSQDSGFKLFQDVLLLCTI